MARRTKEEAEATRESILDAAEAQFHERGVARTSLEDIARAAGVTRGAIYWHFRDKAALFDAMMERVVLPLDCAMQRVVQPEVTDPLAQMREAMLGALRATTEGAQARRVLEIALHKVEYVEEMAAVRERRIAALDERMRNMVQAFEHAKAAGRLNLAVSCETAALGLHSLVEGLLINWMLRPGAFDLMRVAEDLVDAYLRGLDTPRS